MSTSDSVSVNVIEEPSDVQDSDTKDCDDVTASVRFAS